MRFAFYDVYGGALSFVARVLDEGHDALLYQDPGKPPRDDLIHIGDGLVPKEQDYESWLTWAKQPDTIAVFCGNSEDCDHTAVRADALREAGIPTIGGGKFALTLEHNRLFGTEIAERAGALIPPYEEFESLSECRKWAQSLGDTEVYFKSDKFIDSDATYGAKNGEDLASFLEHLRTKTPDRTKCIVQQKIDGVPFSTAQWWNGKTFIGPIEHTIEHKKFMNGDIGPATGCSLNVVWFTQESTVADNLGWRNLEPIFREHNAPPGLYDINAIIDKKGDAYFLEWTPRFGYDSELTSFRLFSSLADVFVAAALGSGTADVSPDLAYSVRLGVPPYPYAHLRWVDKHTPIGTPVGEVDGLWDGSFIAGGLMESDGGLVVADPGGMVGLAFAQGNDIEKLHEEAMEFAKGVRCQGLMYRTDGAKVLAEDAKNLDDSGVNVHPGLLKKEPAHGLNRAG